jgi:hypothetical protein
MNIEVELEVEKKELTPQPPASKNIILKFPDPGKPEIKPFNAKLTKNKRKLFLKYLAERYNKTVAAAKVGVTVSAINDLLKRDERFKKAYDYVLDFHLDKCEESMFVVAAEPSREGFQDRKLALTTYRREIYGDRTEINLQHNITVTNSGPEIRRILATQGENIQEAEYEDISK